MKNFKVGQKVVCIEETPSGSVKEGEIYTVIGYSKVHPQGVLLKEAVSKHGDAGFWEHRFKSLQYENISLRIINNLKLVEEKSDIQIKELEKYD